MSKLSKKAGKAPGSMDYVGPSMDKPSLIERISYDQENLIIETISHKQTFPVKENLINFILVHGVHDVEAVRAISEEFDIHPLTRDDIVNTLHRPKLDWDGRHLFLTMKTCFLDDESQDMMFEQVSFFISGNTLVCFRQNRDDIFGKIKKRLENRESRIRKFGVDYLLYVLMDVLIDNYFSVLEKMGVDQDELQEEMIEQPAQEHLEKIFQIRRDSSALRQAIWPLREILNSIQNREISLFRAESRVFFKDLHDHCLQIMDSLEMIREMNTTLHEVYLSLISHRMNTVMKLLTIIATIFIPLTFIAGVYGMNFEFMPELTWKSGYFLCLGLMAAIGLGLAGFFKYKNWF
jgi:magnesium transporter